MQPIFKSYTQGQVELFPQRLDDYIGENDPVRLVNQVVDDLDLSSVIKSYKGGGTSSFCPRMMIKVLFYAYMRWHLLLPENRSCSFGECSLSLAYR